MSRVFPAHAYGDAPRARCYWPTTVDPISAETARGDIRADMAIIGGGFTGISAALHLAEAGADVVVLEAETLGWGASGRNGGFCCLGGSAASDAMLRRMYGEAARREFCEAEVEAVALARGLIARFGMHVDAHSEGKTLMAHTQAAWRGFEEKARQIEADYGVTPEVIAKDQLAQHGLRSGFHGALTNPIGVALNPMKYLGGMIHAARDAGARVFANSAVRRIDQGDGFTLQTDQAQISARKLIIATNGYSSDDLPGWMRARYLPTQSNIIVTEPIRREDQAAQGWTSNQMCYDDRFFLHYFRLMPNGRMLFGMRGGLRCSPAGDAAMFKRMGAHFTRMFPAWSHVKPEFVWHGLLSISSDLTPYAGPIPEMPGAFTGLSYHGNGVAMASYSGALLADQVLGRSNRLHPTIMQRPPARMPLGRFRRMLMWPAYAAAVLKGD